MSAQAGTGKIPSTLVRVRSIRPKKQVRPLKKTSSASSQSLNSTQSSDDMTTSFASDHFLPDYRDITYNQKTLRLYSTDLDFLNKSVEVLNRHYANENCKTDPIDLLL